MAVRENEDAAKALGVDVFRVKLGAITLSGAMAAAAGVFYAQIFLFLDSGIAFGPHVSVEALLGPIIGGLGTAFGPDRRRHRAARARRRRQARDGRCARASTSSSTACC